MLFEQFLLVYAFPCNIDPIYIHNYTCVFDVHLHISGIYSLCCYVCLFIPDSSSPLWQDPSRPRTDPSFLDGGFVFNTSLDKVGLV